MKRVRQLPKLPQRAADGHKGDYGTVLVVAGSETMLGAAILCATSALRAGAGLVQVALPKALLPLLPVLPERANATGEAAIIAPGGAFYTLSYDHEGTRVAHALAGKQQGHVDTTPLSSAFISKAAAIRALV